MILSTPPRAISEIGSMFNPTRKTNVQMRTTSIFATAIFFVVLTTSPATVWSANAEDVFSEVAASVVVVLALNGRGETTAQGSGVVVGVNEVVTNCHVLDNATGLAVRQAANWSGGKSYLMTASLLAHNRERDLCLLFVEQLPLPPAAKVAYLGTAKGLSVGEEVYAVGAPAGLELSLSRGIVSQLRGSLDKQVAPLVQTDVAISPGSSGGGLFNQSGELVGVTTFKLRGENLNFAVPVEWVADLRTQSLQLTKATARAACVKNPTYWCAIGLAWYEAYSIDLTGIRSDRLREIAIAQADVGDTSGARRTLRHAASEAARDHDIFWWSKELARIAIAQTSIGDTEAAKQTLFTLRDTIDKVAADTSRVYPNLDLGSLAAALAHSGQVQDAIEIASRIKEDNGNRLRSMAEIAQAQAEAGDDESAMKTALSIDDDNLRVRALLALVNMQAKRGDYALAINTVMNTDTFELYDDELSEEFGSLAGLAAFYITHWQLARGDYEAAEQTITAASRHGSALLLMLYSAIVHAKKGNFEAAQAIIDDFEIGTPILLGEIAVLQARSGDGQAARKTLEAALKAARDNHEADHHRAQQVGIVAAAHAKAGFPQIARQLLEEVQLTLDAARKAISKENSHRIIYTEGEIAGLQAEAGFAAMGIETALDIDTLSRSYSGETQRVEALISIARHLAGKPPLPLWYPQKENFFWRF